MKFKKIIAGAVFISIVIWLIKGGIFSSSQKRVRQQQPVEKKVIIPTPPIPPQQGWKININPNEKNAYTWMSPTTVNAPTEPLELRGKDTTFRIFTPVLQEMIQVDGKVVTFLADPGTGANYLVEEGVLSPQPWPASEHKRVASVSTHVRFKPWQGGLINLQVGQK